MNFGNGGGIINYNTQNFNFDELIKSYISNTYPRIVNLFGIHTLIPEKSLPKDFVKVTHQNYVLYHSNQMNKEKGSRYSMDFRIYPESNYSENSGFFSQSANLEFAKGNYYSFL